ncbi:MAG: hypothetical protein ACRDO9_09670, partial [Gaiellales bacterium]
MASLTDVVKKVTICHSGNGKNYVTNEPDATADVGGHNGHDFDIIPPFEYQDQSGIHQYPGKNWDAEGQAIYDNGCNVPE